MYIIRIVWLSSVMGHFKGVAAIHRQNMHQRNSFILPQATPIRGYSRPDLDRGGGGRKKVWTTHGGDGKSKVLADVTVTKKLVNDSENLRWG